ncbi:MAG: putative secreted protein [Alphaproteobacteria bacterium]|nr:MAG: putative secreted protein [Caulobacteraceae bacterium]TPW07548.1 MAG: putative secreted protein [Alphaproteobacteria bacterium]
MTMNKLILAAVFATPCACAPAVAPQTSTPPTQAAASRPSDSPDIANCAARGGVVDTVGRMQRQVCRVPYADAGKTCSNKSDCTARCILDNEEGGEVPAKGKVTGQCQHYETQFGCFSEVDGGLVTSTICVD